MEFDSNEKYGWEHIGRKVGRLIVVRNKNGVVATNHLGGSPLDGVLPLSIPNPSLKTLQFMLHSIKGVLQIFNFIKY